MELTKKKSNEAIDRAVRQLCVDTIKLVAEDTSPKQLQTCEKILRKQFGFDNNAIAELRK